MERGFGARSVPSHPPENTQTVISSKRRSSIMFRRVVLGLSSATVLALVSALGYSVALHVSPLSAAAAGRCNGLPNETALRGFLAAAPATNGDAGGLFHGTKMWAAVVNRDGEFCAAATSTADPSQVWPGSQAIAKAKAYTANAFSLDSLALSSAMLYTFTQPGHSLWSLGGGNPFNPKSLSAPGSQ